MDEKLTWVEAALLLALFSAFFVALYMTAAHYYPGEKLGDIATWLGAAGAFLAFAGTLVIATEERRTTAREKKIRARVRAPGICIQIARLNPLLRQAIRDLQNPPGPLPTVFECWCMELGAAAIWTIEDMEVVACLPNECAVNLALAKEIVRQCAAAMEHSGRYAKIADLVQQLNSAIRHGEAAESELHRVIEQLP